ncbi:unnamed protein product [Kluyveromyces dobzhanskii CBS 2104]|uniref:Post-GPI attachment to proteins factor 3 n=1 Tax=Kluyveromyces dobzhanskii CBS 2104 TaxID=1427455 RepID=A0A0A8L3T3_9SACH|nr:unnamed protein product [Kluyveromyces dobzhanskii CBS 2104]
MIVETIFRQRVSNCLIHLGSLNLFNSFNRFNWWLKNHLERKLKIFVKEASVFRVRRLLNYQFIAVAGMLAWICSSVFHTRDLIITEKLDYFFAGATVLAGFHAVFYRVLRLDMHPRIGKLFTAFTFVIFSGHILRLYLDWSYTYNMRFNIFFGLLQYVMLITVAILNYQRLSTSRAHLIYDLTIVPIGLVVFTGVAMSSELFDFFNYDWQIDSHAIWHALTVLPSFYLYRFFLKDYNFLSSKSVVNIKDT